MNREKGKPGYPIRGGIINCIYALEHSLKDAAKVDRRGIRTSNRRLRKELKEVILHLQHLRKLSIQRANQEKELRSIHKEMINADLG